MDSCPKAFPGLKWEGGELPSQTEAALRIKAPKCQMSHGSESVPLHLLSHIGHVQKHIVSKRLF